MIPVGVCVRTEKGYFYVSGDSVRLRINSVKVLKSWAFPSIWTLTDSEVSHLAVVGTLGFRPGTIIKDYGSKKEYLISKSSKVHITSPLFYQKRGLGKKFKPLYVSSKEANLHKDGGEV